uniref:Uncharacterized protein n=1 Tax=Parascaris univalens TaxID=6257 RepID=A0A915BA36_PARUN
MFASPDGTEERQSSLLTRLERYGDAERGFPDEHVVAVALSGIFHYGLCPEFVIHTVCSLRSMAICGDLQTSHDLRQRNYQNVSPSNAPALVSLLLR